MLEAARSDNVEAVRQLLGAGVALDKRDEHGRTAIHWAATGGATETGALLLDRGADVDARAQFGMTPLHWAAMTGQVRMVDLLIRRGADIRALNSYGMTPLHMAANVDVVRVLLERSAPVSERDYRGMTPLHLARTSQVARTLMPAGADPFVRAIDGRRPLDMAMGGDWEKSGLVIYSARAKARLRGEEGMLAFEILNVSPERHVALSLSAGSPGCLTKVVPSSLEQLDPGQLSSFTIQLSRRSGLEEGEYPLDLEIEAKGRPTTRLTLSVNTSRGEIPEDRGMMRVGTIKVRRASPRLLQYLPFLAVPLVMVGLLLFWRRRRQSGS